MLNSCSCLSWLKAGCVCGMRITLLEKGLERWKGMCPLHVGLFTHTPLITCWDIPDHQKAKWDPSSSPSLLFLSPLLFLDISPKIRTRTGTSSGVCLESLFLEVIAKPCFPSESFHSGGIQMIEHFQWAEAQSREQTKAWKYSVKINFLKKSVLGCLGFITSKGCEVDNSASWVCWVWGFFFAETEELASKKLLAASTEHQLSFSFLLWNKLMQWNKGKTPSYLVQYFPWLQHNLFLFRKIQCCK